MSQRCPGSHSSLPLHPPQQLSDQRPQKKRNGWNVVQRLSLCSHIYMGPVTEKNGNWACQRPSPYKVSFPYLHLTWFRRYKSILTQETFRSHKSKMGVWATEAPETKGHSSATWVCSFTTLCWRQQSPLPGEEVQHGHPAHEVRDNSISLLKRLWMSVSYVFYLKTSYR